MPAIFPGIRTTAVISIGAVTLAAFIAARVGSERIYDRGDVTQ